MRSLANQVVMRAREGGHHRFKSQRKRTDIYIGDNQARMRMPMQGTM